MPCPKQQPDIRGITPRVNARADTVNASKGDVEEDKAGDDIVHASSKITQETGTSIIETSPTIYGGRDEVYLVEEKVTAKVNAGADTANSNKNKAREAVSTKVKAGTDTVNASKQQAQEAVSTTVKAGADNIEKIRSRAQQHKFLLAMPPSVAVLTVPGDNSVATPDCATLQCWARVKWCKQERELLVFRMADSLDTASQQIYELHEQLKVAFEHRKPLQGPFLWAAHDLKVCQEIQTHEMYVLKQDSEVGTKPFWWKVLRGLMIITPSFQGPVLKLYRAQFGPEVAFQFACSYLHVQHLWWLCVICLVMFFMNIQPKSSSEREPDWYKWIVGMTLVWLWLAFSTFQNWRKMRHLEACPAEESHTLTPHNFRPVNRNFRPVEEATVTTRRRCKAIFCILPAGAFFLCIYVGVFWLVTSMILAVIGNWGKCIERMAREDPKICRDPTFEKGGVGTVVEIACDVFLVILLEILMPLGEIFGGWLADVQNFKYQDDRDFFISQVMAALGSFERVGFVFMLAMRFAPQWENPNEAAAEANWTGDIDDFVDPVEDCSDFWLKEHSIGCIRRKLGVNKRRYMFETLMKGPFIVAPFVAIVIKVLVPLIVHIAVYKLYGGRKILAKQKLGPCCMFWRLAALIFAYEPGNAGGLGFVVNGWPFEDLEIFESNLLREEHAIDPMIDGDHIQTELAYVQYILLQSFQKNYEPWAELFDLKMSKLWIAFFTPIMPVGVLFTTAAQILKINFDMVKLLWARVRPLPRSYNMALRSHMAFSYAVLVGTLGWYIGLQLMTYNNDFYTWKYGADACFFLFVMWEVGTFALASYYWE